MNPIVFILLMLIVAIATVAAWLYALKRTDDVRITSLVMVAGACVQLILLSIYVK